MLPGHKTPTSNQPVTGIGQLVMGEEYEHLFHWTAASVREPFAGGNPLYKTISVEHVAQCAATHNICSCHCHQW